MKKVFITLLLCSITQLCFSQDAFTFNQGGTTQTDYFSTIPYENVRGKIIVKATIAGETFRFIVDTGAPTTISKKIYDKLNSSALNRMPVIDQSGKEDSVLVIKLSAITLGAVTFTNIPSLVAENSIILECFQVDGFIGSNLLRNSIIQFDNNQKTLTLTDSETKLSLDRKTGSELVLNKIQSSPYIWVKLQGKKKGSEQLLLDSGMDGLYDLSLRNYPIFEKKKIFEVLARANGSNTIGFHGTADDADQLLLRLPTLEVNGMVFKNITVQTTPATNSRIGSKLLESGWVTIDYRNKLFYIKAFSNNPIDLMEKTFLVSPTFRDNQLQVGIVWSSLLRDKLKPGDQILFVDDISFETIDVCSLLTKDSAFKDKKRIVLTTKNAEGLIQKVEIARD